MGLSRRDRRRRSGENVRRHHELRQAQAALAGRASHQRQELEARLQQVGRQVAANAVLADREYSFCLYPEEKLRPFLTSLVS
jgi:hypothetical protein